jgi:hypothetical protein
MNMTVDTLWAQPTCPWRLVNRGLISPRFELHQRRNAVPTQSASSFMSFCKQTKVGFMIIQTWRSKQTTCFISGHHLYCMVFCGHVHIINSTVQYILSVPFQLLRNLAWKKKKYTYRRKTVPSSMISHSKSCRIWKCYLVRIYRDQSYFNIKIECGRARFVTRGPHTQDFVWSITLGVARGGHMYM